MDRITVSITEKQHERLEQFVESGEFQSKSEAVRELLESAEYEQSLEERITRLEREHALLIDRLGLASAHSLPAYSFSKRLRWLLLGTQGND